MGFDLSQYNKLLAEQKTELAEQYIADSVPDYLYKYYWLSKGEDKNNDEKRFTSLILNSNWFAVSDEQNDPFEFKMGYVSERLIEKKNASDIAAKAAKFSLEYMRNNTLLCSFTATDENNLPMWASYSNNHYGYCVKYKVNNKRALMRVFYEKDRIGVLGVPLGFINEAKLSDEQEQETDGLKFYRHMIMQLMCVKHISWAHEKEYRIIQPRDGAVFGRNIENTIITPVDLYIGFNCIPEYERRLISICKDNLNCNVYKSRIGETSFLEFDKL